jgi:deoxyribodipyrimidine photo-lyase
MKINLQRVSVSLHEKITNGPIIYWMSRDQRVEDNWAFLYAQELALEAKQPLVVVFCLVPEFLGATMRQYRFMLKGLEELEEKLLALHIPFYLLLGEPAEELEKFCKKITAGAVVTDFDPLKIKRKWKEDASKKLNCAFFEVDAHNIVPCWNASPKQEFGAYTIRPKIHKLLPEFLTEFPKIKKQDAIKSFTSEKNKLEKNIFFIENRFNSRGS